MPGRDAGPGTATVADHGIVGGPTWGSTLVGPVEEDARRTERRVDDDVVAVDLGDDGLPLSEPCG